MILLQVIMENDKYFTRDISMRIFLLLNLLLLFLVWQLKTYLQNRPLSRWNYENINTFSDIIVVQILIYVYVL